MAERKRAERKGAQQASNAEKIRLDKWLWAARFFKTRSLAKQAVEGGKVHYNGARVKVSKEVELGAELSIRQGWDEKTVHVLALSSNRQGAAQALLLYQETEQSQEKRQQQAIQRKQMNQGQVPSDRPSKKQRRQIHRFKHINTE